MLEADHGEEKLPNPFKDIKKLYLMHLFFALVSRMWDMGIILLIAELSHNSLFLVALAGFLSSFSIFLFMSWIGRWLDNNNRMKATRVALFVKIVVVSVSYLLCAMLSVDSIQSRPIFRSLLYLLPVLCALASLSFSTITQSIEKDWLVVLSDGDSNWLSATNSVMSQIDLGCNAVGPAITGVLFSYFSPTLMAITLLGLNALVTFALLMYMQDLYHSWPSLSTRSPRQPPSRTAPSGSHAKNDSSLKYTSLESSESNDDHSEFIGDENKSKQDRAPLTSHATNSSRYFSSWSFWIVVDALYEFGKSGCAGVMTSYSFLYFTVLSFGGLMTVYLRWCGLSDYWIGTSRGLASLTGFAGAAIFPAMIKRFGIWNTGLIAIWYQCSLVGLAASSFFWLDRAGSMMMVLIATLFSRTGLWLFDLCARQIAQERIEEAVRGRINGQWRSIIAFFDMSTYGVAIAIPDPQHFSVLTTISAIMVFSAAVSYTLTRGTDGDRNDQPVTTERDRDRDAQEENPSFASDIDDDDDEQTIELSHVGRNEC